LLARHSTGFGTIHSTANFLPWHRWFAEEMEDLLQHVDCRVTLPWWDWSKKSAAPFVGSPFIDAPSWLGTNGVSGCVQDGPFDTSIWNPPNVACLNRQFSGTMPTSVQIASVLSTSSGAYSTFSDALETQIHNSPHVRIGGTMVTGYSPDAPEFFMHHGFIDKLWNDWQKKSSAHLNAYSFSLTSAMPYAMGATPGDVNDLKESGIMYVRYSNPTATGHLVWFNKCMLIRVAPFPHLFDLADIQLKIMEADPEVLARVPQLPFAALNEEEGRQMIDMAWKSGASQEEVAQMERKLKVAAEQARRANEGRNIVFKFEDEHSQQVGYDLPTIIELLGVEPACAPGEAWSEREQTCVPVSCDSPNACGRDEKCVPVDVYCIESPCPQFKCIRSTLTIDPVNAFKEASTLTFDPVITFAETSKLSAFRGRG